MQIISLLQLNCCQRKQLGTTFSKHLPAALLSLLRKTEVKFKQLHFCPAKTADRINRCPAARLHKCVCVRGKKTKTKKQLYRQNSVCAVLNSLENPVAFWVIHLMNKAGFPSAAAMCMCAREKGEKKVSNGLQEAYHIAPFSNWINS